MEAYYFLIILLQGNICMIKNVPNHQLKIQYSSDFTNIYNKTEIAIFSDIILIKFK